jgi:hypothetical protein
LTTGQNQSEGDKVCPSLSVVLPLSDVNFLLKEEIAALTDKKNVTDQEQTKLRLTVDSLLCELESVNRTIAGKEDIILKLKVDSSSKTEEFKGEIEMKALSCFNEDTSSR